MKTTLLILTLVTSFLGCSKEDDNKQGENAIIYHYSDPGFGGSQCEFVLETAKGEIFVVKRTSNLSPFVNNTGANGSKVRVTYRTLPNKIEKCHHKNSFLKEPVTQIEVTHIEKI